MMPGLVQTVPSIVLERKGESIGSIKADRQMNAAGSLAVMHRYCSISHCNAEDADNTAALQVWAESLYYEINPHVIMSHQVFP